MSKRSRREFDSDSTSTRQSPLGAKPAKRSRKNSQKSATESENDNEYECPVCYEDFSGKIFQCQEGHLLCEQCHPKFKQCPTCRISLAPNIRNRILEQILSSKPKEKKKQRSSPQYLCNLCRRAFESEDALNKHLNLCDQRMIKCPFQDCKWINTFSKFPDHAKTAHHTCHGSKQPSPEESKIYHFNHAIKFPKDTFTRETSDFVWPKIVRFKDGKDFFVLTRYKSDCITVFVRSMTLPRLDSADLKKLKKAMDTQTQLRLGKAKDQILGKYWIEFRLKEKNAGNHNRNKKKQDKDYGYDAVPLRWPCDLYGVTVPFKDDEQGQVLKVHRSIFTRYWSQESVEASAVLRFQFRTTLS